MKPWSYFLGAILISIQFHCSEPAAPAHQTKKTALPAGPVLDEAAPADSSGNPRTDAAMILSRKEVPVLCYHRIREWRVSDSRSAKDNIIPPETFQQHMQQLADSGFTAILPDELHDYLMSGRQLPEKPVMITFDDGSDGQYDFGLPALEKHGFKGVFFIMTIATGKPGYLSRAQLREMSDKGHVIASHSWDHKNMLKYDSTDWERQLDGSVRTLQEITGKPVHYFAYPYGLWSSAAFPHLRQAGFRSAFILSTKRDTTNPIYTIRRVNVPGHWSASTLLQVASRTFATTKSTVQQPEAY